MLIFACAIITVLAGLYVLRPLFPDTTGELDADLLAETELDRLIERKSLVYAGLKDLEFEYQMGRLSHEDFKRLDEDYRAEATAILQKIDLLDAADAAGETSQKARQKAGADDRRAEPAPDSAHCSACGAAVIPGKNFCADCGQRL